jgi:hypothetical protein
MTGRPVAALSDADGASSARPGDLGRPVGGAIVDDEGLISDGQAIKDPGQGGRLIQTRQDHLDRHVAEARYPRWSRASLERFPFAYRVLIPQMTATLQRREFAYAV